MNSSWVAAPAISSDILAAVGSVSASILSITCRYRDTVVWSIPKNAASTPCVGLSFLWTSAMNSACRRYSLHLLPGSEALSSSSRNSGIWPECARNLSARSSMYRNLGPSASVDWRSLSASRIMSSRTSSRCSTAPLEASQSPCLLFHRLRSRSSFSTVCCKLPAFLLQFFLFLLQNLFQILVFPAAVCKSSDQASQAFDVACRFVPALNLWRRQSAALYGRPIYWAAQNGGGRGKALPNGGCKGRPEGALSMPGQSAGPAPARQPPGGALSGGVPPDIMRGGAGAGPPGKGPAERCRQQAARFQAAGACGRRRKGERTGRVAPCFSGRSCGFRRRKAGSSDWQTGSRKTV